MPAKTVEQVLSEHVDAWAALPGFVAAGIGACGGEPCIRILVTELTEAVRSRFPQRLERHLVIVEQSGEMRALSPE